MPTPKGCSSTRINHEPGKVEAVVVINKTKNFLRTTKKYTAFKEYRYGSISLQFM